MNALVMFLIAVLAIAAYFFPSIVAKLRNHHNTLPIFLVTLFLGWSGIGWIGALIWACMSPPPARN